MKNGYCSESAPLREIVEYKTNPGIITLIDYKWRFKVPSAFQTNVYADLMLIDMMVLTSS